MGTYIHETVHAAVRQFHLMINELQKKEDKTSSDYQFINNYNKLFPSTLGNDFKDGISEIIKAVDAEWFKQKQDYRSSQGEAVAFGVGNQFKGGSGDYYNTPKHVDTTLATTFMIMLEQASKIVKSKK